MKIGIIGSGNVGGTLGSRLAAAGHRVIFSSRNPSSDAMKQLIAKSGANATAATVEEAVAASEVIILATPWPSTADAVKGTGGLNGKIIIDATNPLHEKLDGLEFGNSTSGAEQVQSWAPGAKVVKAFNTIGYGIMADPNFSGTPATLLYCGDDDAAKKTVHQLAEQLGFRPENAGPLTQARTLEPLALLWITLAIFHGYGPNIAFNLVRR